MSVWRVEFDRIGRTRRDENGEPVPPEPLTVRVPEGRDVADTIGRAVYALARPMLLSAEVEVGVDLEEGRGLIVVGGMRPAGEFTVTEVEEEAGG